MFGVPTLAHVDLQHSPDGLNDSTYRLSTSVPFGLSIQDAIKELSLEEDGDMRTFLARSTALLTTVSPPPTTKSQPESSSNLHHGAGPSLVPLHLNRLDMPDEDQVGSRAYLETFVEPPRQSHSQTIADAWEYVLPSEIESTFGVNSTPVQSRRRRKYPGGNNADKRESTPVTSLKYVIRTPPSSAPSSTRMSTTPSSHQVIPSDLLKPAREQGIAPSAQSNQDISSKRTTDLQEATNAVELRSSSKEVLGEKDALIEERSKSPLLPEFNPEELLRWPHLEDFFISMPEWATCSICSELFDGPVQWPACEHTFCKACVTRIMTYGHRECPLCRGVLPNDFGFEELSVSSKMLSAILLLPVRCRWGLISRRSNTPSHSATLSSTPSSSSMASFGQLSFGPLSSSVGSAGSSRSSSISSLEEYMRDQPESKWIPRADDLGCPDIVPLSSLPSHLLTCPHAPVRCLYSGCRMMVKRYAIETHQAACPHKPAQCRHCLETFTRESLPNHYHICPESSITCECGETMLRKSLPLHSNSTCPYAQLSCPFSRHGCTYIGRRGELDSHLASCPYEALKGYIAQTELRFQEYDRTIERLESMVLALRTQIHNNGRNAPRSTVQPGFTTATSSRSSNSSSYQPPTTGAVGHGRREGRFWEDYNDLASDDEFSIYL